MGGSTKAKKKASSKAKQAASPPPPPSEHAAAAATGSPSSAADDQAPGGAEGAEQAPQDFEAWYLRRVTAELADELESLRKAKDFTDDSVPVLVDALQGSAVLFSAEDRERIMAAAAADDGRT